MNDLIASDPEQAWRLIRAMVAYAPDYGVLAGVAAGPVESLIDQHEDAFMSVFRNEVERNPRFRVCLRAAYTEWPRELADLLEQDAHSGTSLPVAGLRDIDATTEEMALLISWFHHSTTGWASSLLADFTSQDPPSAWDAIRLLLVFAEEDANVRDDVFEHALVPFVRKNFGAHRESLVAVARRHAWLRESFAASKRPQIEDPNTWRDFLADVSAA